MSAVKMVMSHQETSSISSNIRAIIEQLNLDAVEDNRRKKLRAASEPAVPSPMKHSPLSPKVSIGVYGCKRSDYQCCSEVVRKNRTASPVRRREDIRQRTPPVMRKKIETIKVTRPVRETPERIDPTAKEDLPDLETGALSHTAAHHRIAVRPKNRRPPKSKRSNSQSSNGVSVNLITTITESTDDSGTMDSLELASVNDSTVNSANSSPLAAAKSAPIVRRKSSSRLSRNSDIFEELETRLSNSRKPTGGGSAVSLSPDSLDSLPSRANRDENFLQDEIKQDLEEDEEMVPRPMVRKSFSDVSEQSSPIRRASPQTMDSLEESSNPLLLSKSFEKMDKIDHNEIKITKPVPRRRRYLPSSISKSSDHLETLEVFKDESDYPEFGRRAASKLISKSSESFQLMEPNRGLMGGIGDDMRKKNSASDVNLARTRRHSASKSTYPQKDSLERMDVVESKTYDATNNGIIEMRKAVKRTVRRSSDTRMSSESSDNLDMDNDYRFENRQARRTAKRASSVILDVGSSNVDEDKRIVGLIRKPPQPPSRLQKSSESSELSSTDTLDSERRNKSSDSTETLDSLDKDMEQDRKEDEITDSVVDKRDKNDSWSGCTSADDSGHVDESEDGSKSLISSSDKPYWKQSPDAKDNLDIHQLFAITIVTRMADNGNNDQREIYPKKKQQNQQQQKLLTSSAPTSPATKSEDNKLLFNNLIANKNDEDLQNMLNGNISEVSTDTKSFKEKLIMFEKLGK